MIRVIDRNRGSGESNHGLTNLYMVTLLENQELNSHLVQNESA